MRPLLHRFARQQKLEFLQKDMMVQRKTATKYLDMIVDAGLLDKIKLGRSNYYINAKLMDLFISQGINDNKEIDNRIGK